MATAASRMCSTHRSPSRGATGPANRRADPQPRRARSDMTVRGPQARIPDSTVGGLSHAVRQAQEAWFAGRRRRPRSAASGPGQAHAHESARTGPGAHREPAEPRTERADAADDGGPRPREPHSARRGDPQVLRPARRHQSDQGTGIIGPARALPDQGIPKANWAQNAGRLREQMRSGEPICDSYRTEDGAQIPARPGSFLDAERRLLESRGWRYNPQTGAYHPGTP